MSASITNGDHIGIVGANGCGKTTLVRIIKGEIEPVSGSVLRESGTQIGYVPQHLNVPDDETVGRFLLGHVHRQRRKLRELEHRMATLAAEDRELVRVLDAYQTVRETYDAAEGDTAEERTRGLLDELGLSCTLEQKLRTLSGGERNVLSLAEALVERPNLLILDEPGNHLDFAGLAWLESYLGRFPGAVLLVSHNRYLLDQVATSIWELFRGGLTTFAGDYSDYRFARLTQALNDQADYSVQQRKIGRLEALVKTFEQRARTTADPAWGKRLRARRSQLAKARDQAMAQPEIETRPIKVHFADETVKSDIAVEVRLYSKQIGTRVLFEDANLLVHVGERVGIIGPNGCGKTTFLNDIVERGRWDDATLRVGPSMKIGFCAQHRDRFPAATTVMDAVLSLGSFTRKDIFRTLSRLLFSWNDLDRPVASLSGGEWNRLQLGMAIIAKANLLVLDEPTNHLDIPSREAVEEALAEYAGTVIAVSHDRYFLDAAVARIEEIIDGQFVSYSGNFSDYWHERSAGRRIDGASVARRKRQVSSQQKPVRDARRSDDGDARIETQILELEEKQIELESRMTRAFESSSLQEGRRLAAEIKKIRARIDELYRRWGVDR